MVSLLVRATSFYGACYSCARKFLSNAAVTRGFLFLFLRLLHFVSNVFFSIVAKNKKIKSKNNNTHNTNTFLLVPYASKVVLREKKRTRKASKSRGIRGCVSDSSRSNDRFLSSARL